MKLKLLSSELQLIVGDISTSTGSVSSVKILKKNNFIILETFGVYLETDLTVQGLTASYGTSTDKVSLQWNPFTGIDGYKVFKSPAQLLSIQTGITFDDTSTDPGKLTKYFVKTFILKDGLTYDSKSVYADGWKKLIPPTIRLTGEPDVPRVILDWDSVEGATAYKIFRTEGSDPALLTQYGITGSSLFIDRKVQFGKVYSYSVKSSCSLGDSDLSNVENVILRGQVPAAPSQVSASTGQFTDKVRISWTPVPNVFFYNVYRGSETNRIATNIVGTEFDDIFTDPEETNIYGVGAENVNGQGIVTFSSLGWKGISAPSNFSASNGGSTNSILLEWFPVQGANSYKIYKGNPLQEYQTGILGLSFNDTTELVYGTVFNYGVRAVGSLGESQISEDTGFLAQARPETAPTGVSASDGVYTDKIEITWNPVTTIQGISGYEVLKNGSIFTTTSFTNIIDSIATPGLTFEYIVRAFNNAGSGLSSLGNTGWIKLSPPINFSASNFKSASEIELNWSQSNGATTYKIFRGVSLGSLAEIDQTANTIYTDTGLGFGVSFAYAVKASSGLGDSDFSNLDIGETGTPIPLPNAPTGLSASDGAFTDRIDITWDSVAGISGYNLFRNGFQIADLTTESFTDTPSPGIIFNYEIAARNIAGIGNTSSGNTGWRALIAPTNFTATNNLSDRINLNWIATAGATAYKIFTGSSFNPDLNVSLIGFTTNTSFSDFTPTFGNAYTYAVKSSCALGDSDYTIPVIGRVSQSPPETAPTGISASDGTFNNKVLITWTPPVTIMGVSSYNIHKIAPNGSVTIQNTATIPFEDFTGIPGLTFEYKIAAVNLAGVGPLSAGNTGWKGLTAPTQFAATDGTFTDKIRLSWNSIHGTDISYRIYKGNPLTPLTTTTSTFFEDTTAAASPGITLQYAVSAFSSLPIESILSNIDIGFIGLTAPSNIVATQGIVVNEVGITWDAVAGAQQYRIYKDDTSNLIGITFSNSFGDTLATPGLTHGYFVSTFLPGFPYESVKSSRVVGWKKLQTPTGLTASKGDFSDKVRISWNTVPGATAYKIFKADNFDPEINVTLVGITTDNVFFDTSVAGSTGITYAVKASSIISDSNYSNTDIGYLNSVYSQILQYTQDIKSRYRENVNGVYTLASPRLTPWTGDLSYQPMTGKKVIEGLTGLPSAQTGFAGITLGKNIYDNAGQILYYFGINNGPQGSTLIAGDINQKGGTFAYYPTDKILNKYQHLPWYIDLDLQRGITSRGGTGSWFNRPSSFNEIAATPYPNVTVANDVWANPRNKLLFYLGKIDEDQGTNGRLFDDMVTMAAAWKFSMRLSGNLIGLRTFSRTDVNVRIVNQDILSTLKTILDKVKSHYPLIRPQNNLSSSTTQTWISDQAYGGLSGEFRKPIPPIGDILDNVPGMGVVDTFSPSGLTGDQGEYLFEGWKRRDLVNTMHLLTGITVSRMPEGVSSGQELASLPGWQETITGIKELLIKEIYDHVRQYWEKRAWYQKVLPNAGRDTEYQGDIDNLGWISNQWIEPLSGTLLATMYVYQFAQTQVEKDALRAVYNMGTEVLAGLLERMLWNVGSDDEAGNWIEGYGYASQSMDGVLLLLDSMKQMGDRRLWDTVSNRGRGISYSAWTNNAWKWLTSRIMPNGLIINAGSVDADSYTDPNNDYHIYGTPLTLSSILVSEFPVPGTPNSAIAQWFKVFRKIWGWGGGAGAIGISNLYYYEQKLYSESVGDANPIRTFKRGYFYPADQTFVWKSNFIIPIEQYTEFGRGYDFNRNRGTTYTSKPFIFGLWGKGAGKFDGKAHRDEGHVSAYMGDAVLLLDSGEIRAAADANGGNNPRAYFEKYSQGHNRMQLGEALSPIFPRPANILGKYFGETGGWVFMDTTNSYNIRSVTAAAAADDVGPRGGFPVGVPWGYDHRWQKVPYQYQIQKVTRGISWSYEPFNTVSSHIRISDFMGISGMCAGVSGPTDRVYYRFHVGYTGATSGSDPGFVIDPVSGSNNKSWNVSWTQPVAIHYVMGGYTFNQVGVTMTFTADQPIQVSKLLVSNRGMKWTQNTSDVNKQTKNYALDIRLGLSGAAVHNENKLNLVTEINSIVFRNGAPIIIQTETPQIRHYGAYTLNSTATISKSTGCGSGFAAPTNIFPSWDANLSEYSGISFGRILIRDFSKLSPRSGFTLPNDTWTCP